MTINIDNIRSVQGVRSINDWQDRTYINLVGNGANYAGERNTKVYVRNNKLIVEMGKGMYSSEWYTNLKGLKAWVVANGGEI